MFSSISKAWDEVSGEGQTNGNSVKFSDSERESLSRKKGHYIHYDRSKNPLDRIKKPEGRRGSPRILQTTKESKQNSLWGSALKNLSKVFKKEDGELGDMKDYMNGMIKVPKERQRSIRPQQIDKPNTEYLETNLINSRRRKRTDTIGSKFDSPGSSFNEKFKRRRHHDISETPKYEKYSKFEINVPKYTYQDKDNERHNLRNILNYSNSLEKEKINNNIVHEDSYRFHKYGSNDLSTGPKKIKFSKLTALDLPSSPILYNNERTTPVVEGQITTTNHHENSIVDTSKIDELCKKVEQLENTVESLRDELRQANERSVQLENTEQSNDHTILKGIDDSESLDHFKFEDDQEIARPLSPVKVDLDRFKFIR